MDRKARIRELLGPAQGAPAPISVNINVEVLSKKSTSAVTCYQKKRFN